MGRNRKRQKAEIQSEAKEETNKYFAVDNTECEQSFK
jgi:hypothetical protein